MKTYRIELEEIYNKEMEGIANLFASYECKIYENNVLTKEISLSEVNAWKGLPPILTALLEQGYGIKTPGKD